MLYRMDRDYDIQDAFGTPQSLGAFKVVLDATFHEFFGAPSAPFIGYRGYEKDSSQYVKIMPANQASSSMKRDFIQISFLNDLSILKGNSEY